MEFGGVYKIIADGPYCHLFFDDGTKKGYSQYITYEYRDSHKSYFLGANGGKGINLINLLMDEKYGIKYHSEDFQF